ncbi:LamG-like jellyroll fold domain-containing protein [Candidatus Albibeggiatoa sp. nov. NOAA]|uniref:LamG-like jellyroll fold domain-containing protein n=1 Tax=Candidatus Albibeggiatoa sp. nov. NOAA TaxID=3162724 RepID=UPI0032FBA8AC|nr:LamG domain-containing protein [Thiotrichaceae bacterium]
MSNKLKILFTITLLCSVLFTSVAYADAPNGVSNNLQLWLKADVGISETDGQTITNWQDQSPNAYSATNGGSDGQTAPTFKNNSLDNINFNPIVEFDGVANGLDLASNYIYSINDGLTFFAVVKPDTEPNEGNFILDFGRTVTDGYGFSYANDTFRLYTPTAHGGVNSALTSHAYDTDSVLYTGKIDFANEQRIYLNGTSVYNENISLTQITTAEIIENPTHASGQKGPVTIGRQAKPLVGNDRLFAGKIAEIILYDTDLSDADRNKVQSYLAIKYGLTLDNSIDYVNASGLYIYPSTLTHSTHTHDIAVIGAETVSGLSQSKSRSVNSDSVVTIEGSSIGDGNFLAWGNDDDALTFTATDTPYGKRLERDWKTSEVGAIGFVTVSFDLTQLSGMGLDITDATKYRLLIDDNGDFSDAIEASGGIISSNTISFSNVSLASTVYFSLAFDVPTRTTYNFNSLTLGDVNGQDDWERTNTGNQPGGNIAIVTEGFDSSNNLKQTTAGNSTTSIASHANLGNLTFFPFVEEAIYAFEFEQQGNCWGQRYGLAYDQNANGEIGATESTEQAIVFQSGACVGGHKFITPSGSVITSTTGHQGGWARFRVIVDLAANSGQGNACVVYKNLTNGDTDWQSMGSLQNVNLGLDSSRTANDRTNPQNWDSVFFWSSGDASWLDNLAFDDAFTLNDADVSLSNSNVSESVVAGTVVGNIEVTTSATYTYSLVAGTGDTDNALFTLDGNQLKTNAVLDYEAQPTRSIRVQVKRTDSGDCAVVEKIFTIAIDNVNETPVAGSSSVLDFDGSDDYVDLGILNGEILGSNARTIEAWVKTTSTATSSIFRYGASAANGRINLRTTDGEIIIEMSGKQTIWSAPNINDGNWHHVAWSYTAGTNLNDGIAYVDGVQLTTQTGSGGTVPPNTQTGIAQIGRRDGDVSLFYFDGQIDEVRLWNTTRTQAEIQANMYTALTGSELGLVSYWNFEEATGTLLNDLNTSSANNGTLTNMDSSDWILDVTGTVGHNLAFTTSISAPISDTLPAYDGDNDTLTYILVDDNSGATVLDDISTGAFTYTPASTGTHTFTYKVNDGAVDSNIVTVTIEVEPNAPPVAGFGSALDFDGVDDYVEIPNSTILQLANTITLEAWINVGSTPSCGSNACSDQAIIGNGLISEKKYLLDVHGGDRSVPGKVEFGGSGLSTPWLWSATASGVVDDNTWHHIAATYDGSEKKIYIDGELSKAEATTGNFETTTNPFYIGGLAGSRQTNGIIDEARVWNIARTQAEIQADMYQALQGDEPNLVGYWPFDEGAGTTAHDETNNSNDGTLTNNPIWVNSAIPISFTTSLSTPISDTLPAYDNEGNTLTYSLVDNNGGAAVLDNASTGAFTYIPASAGTHTFTYKVNDGFDDSNIATVTIEVEPNVAPIAGFATGLDFDGVDDKISITGIDIANQSFTLEFWGKRDTAGNNDYVFGQGIGAANLGLHFGWWSSGEVFQFAFYSNDLTSDTSYVDTNWHHWAGTYDATTKLRTLYRDGIKVAQDTAPADYQGSGTFYIGAIYSSDASLDGKLDEVRIWNTARSEEQIADNYALALKGDEAGLMGYWSFNTGSGSTAIDSSGNNRDGTLNNMDDADWIDINSTIPVQFTTSLSTPFSGLLPATDADGGTLTYSLVNDDSEQPF